MNSPAKNALVGVLAFLIGLAYALCISYQVSDYSEGHNVSGRTLPAILAGLLMLAGAGLAIQSWVRWQGRSSAGETASASPLGRGARLRMAAYVCLVAGYALGLTYIGFVTSTALALWLAMRLSGAGRPILTTAISLAGAAALYGFFTLVMDVYFPEGWLW